MTRHVGIASGSASARRAVARWAFRLFFRERRQQLVIVSVIAVAVAAAVCSVATVFNLPDSPSARFGTAEQLLTYSSRDPAEIADRVASARETLGTVEVIGHDSLPIPGSAERFDVRAQDPHGEFSEGTVRVIHGRLPTADTEVAVTDKVAATFAVRIDGVISAGRAQRTVVGVVENPYDLGDEFVLLPPSADDAFTSVSVLAAASETDLQSYHQSTGGSAVEVRPTSISKAAAAGMLAASTVVFLLVALVASAGFAVVAQRRMRQLGMLAAVGATDRHLKLVLLVHGAIVGVVASGIGTTLGLVGWFTLAHRVEGAAGHRIAAFNLPWMMLIGALVIGVLVPLAAAWWPSRSMPRMSIVDAISLRPPTPRRVRASIVGAMLALGGGVALAALSNQTNPVPLIAGMTSLVVGILLACPPAIRAMAKLARRAPVTTRVALRDLGRYQARSGAALAAISLALGIPIAIMLVATAADRTAAESAGDGNLAETQLLITINHPTGLQVLAPNLTETQLADMHATVADLANTLDHTTVVPLGMAVDPRTAADGRPLVEVGELEAGHEDRFHSVSMFVASPELLSFLKIDSTAIPADAEILSATPNVILIGTGTRGEPATAYRIGPPRYSALPRAFITDAGLATFGLQSTPIGWILESAQQVTDVQLSSARQIAARSGFEIEARHGPASRGAIKAGATAVGALFALVIVAMTVGTIRGEAAGELRTLTATGASGMIRRALTATTAASLAAAGVILGTIGAYLGLIGAYMRHLSRLGDVPIANLLFALVAVPLLGGAVGWCLGGREPSTFAQQSVD
ncbi:MAG: ABC transporter permease [Ilumatobacteraceae bacterium]